MAKLSLYSLRLSEVVISRRVVSLLRPSDEESPTGGETHQEEPKMKDLPAAVFSIVFATPSGEQAQQQVYEQLAYSFACILVACANLLAARGTTCMPASRWGAKGLDVETAIKRHKTDRSMLDIEFTLVSA